MTETTRQFKKQLPRNALSAVLSFAVYSVSAVWLTPYLIEQLGEAAYGLVPLAALFTQYISVMTAQISGAVNRFLTIEINKPDGKPNVVFNSAFALYAFLVVVQIPLFGLGLVYADKLISIPHGLEADVMLMLGCSCAAFLVSLMGAVFSVAQFSKNRVDITSNINLLMLVARLLLIVGCFTIFGPKLRYIGYIGLVLSLARLVIYVVICKKLTPELTLSLKQADFGLMKPVFHLSFWTLVKQIGALLYLRTDIWIINRFISPAAAGKYAAILVLVNFIKQLGNMAVQQVNPTMMAYYAKDERTGLHKLVQRAIKYFVLLLGLVVGCICGLAAKLLETWLGADYGQFETLVWVLAGPLFINIGFTFLYPLQITCNRVRVPSLVTLFLGFINVIGSYYLGVELGLGIMGVALMSSLVITLNDAFFTPMHSARYLLQIPILSIYRNVLPGVMLFPVVFLLCRLPVSLPLSGWLELFVRGGATVAVVMPLVYLFTSLEERKMIFSFFTKAFGHKGKA